MGIGFRELLIILVIALVLFGAKRLRSVGSDLGTAVRGFKKAVNEGDDDATKPVIDQLRAAGVATVIASGNDGFADAVSFPACISTAVTCSARRASWSAKPPA